MNARECYEKSKAYFDNGQYAKSQEFLQKARQLASEELPSVTPSKAVEHLAEKAYDFFIQEYNTSEEFLNDIKEYTKFLVEYHVAEFRGIETSDEVISKVLKSLYAYHEKLIKWILHTIKNSLQKDFPNRFYYIYQVNKMYDDGTPKAENFRVIHIEFANKLAFRFKVELYRSIKENYETALQQNQYLDYLLFATQSGIDKLWHDLSDKTDALMNDCFKCMGLNEMDNENITMQYVMGDKIEIKNAQNFTFVNKSNVVNSFNKVRERFDEETASVIKQIAEIVEKSKNAEAVELFEAFNEEMNKQEPKKSLLKSFWNGLSSVLPVISSTVEIVEKIMKIIK